MNEMEKDSQYHVVIDLDRSIKINGGDRLILI